MTETVSPNCPKCHQSLDTDSRFCKQCGFDLKPPSSIDQAFARQTKIARIIAIGVGVVVLIGIIMFVVAYKSGNVISQDTSTSGPVVQTTQPQPSTQPTAAFRTNNLPPDDLIKTQVKNIMRQSLTNHNFGYQTTSVSFDLVEITRRGEFHPDERLFLVQVRTRGEAEEKYNPTAYGGLSCNNKHPLCEQTCYFDVTNEYRVFRNDFGDWLSQISVPWQFGLGESCGERMVE